MSNSMTLGNIWKKGKTWFIILILIGMLILFILNNFGTQGVYDYVSCTFNTYECEGANNTGSVIGWDGQCTDDIVDECCEETIDVRLCSGDPGDEPWMCDTKYCSGENEACYAEATWDDQQGEYSYECVCKDVTDWQI